MINTDYSYDTHGNIIGPATPNIPSTGSSAPTSSPTVISNTDKTAKVIDMQNHPALNEPRGAVTSDGTTNAQNGDILNIGGTNYQSGYSPSDDASFNAQLENMKAMTDKNTADQISTIQQIMSQRKQQQEAINKASEARVQNALLMGNVTGQGSSAQYAPISSSGIVQAQESYGVQQLAQIDAEEAGLIATARNAGFTKNYALQEKILDRIDAKRKEKADLVAELNKNMLAVNKKQQEDAYQSQIDNSIADVFSSGTTNPAEIMKTLKTKGVNVTSAQVQATLENMAKANGTDYAKMSADTAEFYAMKNKGQLPASILHYKTDAEQLAAYIQGKASGTFTSPTTSAIESPIVQTTMQMMGITQDMSVADAIKTVGIDKVVQAIIGQEGGSPKGVVNNPGNIKFAGLPGQIDSGVKATDGGTFASYKTKQDGINAVANWVTNHSNENLSDAIAKYKGVEVTKKAEYGQVGRLANTSYNPSSPLDKHAKDYIDAYLKSGGSSLPTAAQIFGSSRSTNIKAFADTVDRAKQLYYEATGSSLPDLNILKENKKLITENNKVLNKNELLADTIQRNFDTSIKGEISSDVNKNATLINKVLNPIYLALGSPSVNQALVSNGTISQEFANLISIRNSGGTLAADKELANELLPFGTSVKAQQAVAERLINEAKNIHGALRDQNAKLYAMIDPMETDVNNPNRQTEKKPQGSSAADIQSSDFKFPKKNINEIDWSKNPLMTK